MTLEEAVSVCLANREFVENFNRLAETNIRVPDPPRNPLEALIDQACQIPPVFWTDSEREKFIQFVLEFVWVPLIDNPG